MIYSDLYLHKENKMPTVVGFLFIFFIAVFFSRFFFESSITSNASLKVAKRVEVVNLSPTQAGVYWQTDEFEAGWVIYGETEGSENKAIFDEKDLNNLGEKKGKYKTHFAVLKELKPGKKYYFKIVTENNQIIAQPNKKPFSFTTPKNLINIVQNINPAFGKILGSNAVDPLVNTYIFLTVKGGHPLLTRIKSEGDGSWLIPLSQIYNRDGTNIITISEKDKIVIEFITGEGDAMTVTATKSKVSPLPQTIVFSKNKNISFVEDENVLSATTNLTKLSQIKTEILYPKEGSLIPGTIPLIKGLNNPLTKVEITVNSIKTYSAIVTSDSKGNWSYLLPEALELGPHTVTIKTKDKEGNEIILNRKFTIIAQQGNEGRVLGTASGEPDILPTDTPIPTPTPTTLIETPTTYETPTPNELKKAGNDFSATIFGGLSLIIIGGGILLAF